MESTTITTESKRFPGFWISIGWIALYFLFQIIGGAIAFAVALALSGHTNPNAAELAAITSNLELIALPTVWSLACAGVLTLLLLWLYLRRGNRIAAIRLDRWSGLSPAITIALSVMLVGAGLVFNYAYGAFVFPDVEMQDQVRKMFAAIPKTPANWVLLFATVAVIAPLLEELLFRGLLQNSLSNRMPIWAAIAISSAIFAAIHMQLYAFPALMALGAVFGYIYHKTGSLRVTILLHMINNAAALALG
jgi:membrane protease YdiL (CAAX protease family)